MALILADRVKQESTTTGTGAIAFSGGVDGFQVFSAVCSTNDTLYYVIQDKIGTNFEIGHGTFNASGQIERTNILQSSNSDNAVNFGAGTKEVFITYPADKAVFQNFDGSITIPSTIDGRDLVNDGNKLDGIETNATQDQTASQIRSLVESASDSNVFTDADHTKLNGIEASATADQTNDEIKAAVEAASDSNTFTDADHTKLNGIETSATADQTKSDIDALNIDADTLDGQHGSYYTGYADTAVSNLVDSSPTALNTLNELASALGDDANFSTTVNSNIATKLPLAGGTMTGTLKLNDNVVMYLGTGDDLQLKHDGSNSYVRDLGAGDLFIEGENRIVLRSVTGSEKYIECTLDNSVELFHNNVKKAETVSGGLTVSGTLTATTLAGSLPYSSLTGTPTIPTNNNQLTNGAGYITSYTDTNTTYSAGTGLSLSGTTFNNTITNNNQLTNGAGYVTSDTNTTYSAGTGMSLSGTTFNCTIDSPSEVGLGNLSSSGNSLSGNFTATGNVTAYSDERLKDNIQTIDNALDKVSQMRGVTFTKDDKLSSGVIAQEMEQVAPELVQDGEYKSVAYGNTVGYLIEAIKQLKERNEKLELIVNKLITDVEEMKVCSCP